MKLFILSTLFFITLHTVGFSQKALPIQFRVEKQSMSTPMSEMEDIFFNSPFFTKPVNLKFDGHLLHMQYDNHACMIKEEVTKVESNADFDDDELIIDRSFYTINSCPTDTIMLVIDHEIPYIQMVLPAKNSKGEKIGYTSYKKFISKEELALR